MSDDANMPLFTPLMGLNLNVGTTIIKSVPGFTTNIDAINTQSELVLACLAIVEERCKGNITLTYVTLQLVDLLPDDDTGNEAYGSYLDQLIKID